jgi:hypothetical protein
MKSFALIFLLFTMGCASGHCVNQYQKPADKKVEEKMSQNTEKIKIFKYDGSLQCGMGKGISAEEMQKELGSIVVYSAINKDDGLMHIAMCGANTGKVNIYEIGKADLKKAQELGFKVWTFDEIK